MPTTSQLVHEAFDKLSKHQRCTLEQYADPSSTWQYSLQGAAGQLIPPCPAAVFLNKLEALLAARELNKAFDELDAMHPHRYRLGQHLDKYRLMSTQGYTFPLTENYLSPEELLPALKSFINGLPKPKSVTVRKVVYWGQHALQYEADQGNLRVGMGDTLEELFTILRSRGFDRYTLDGSSMPIPAAPQAKVPEWTLHMCQSDFRIKQGEYFIATVHGGVPEHSQEETANLFLIAPKMKAALKAAILGDLSLASKLFKDSK